MWNQDQLARTLDFAAKAHGDQRVPGSGAPYVVHLVKVATEVLRAFAETRDFDVDLAVTCALLHDSVEDAGVAPEVLAKEFGVAVAAGVSALTKDDALEKPLRMADSLKRLAVQPREVQLVKLADRVTNLEPPPPHWTRARRLAYRDEARLILDALGAAHGPLARRLGERIEAYQRFFDDVR
ncbi:MAG: bifunctional (p)ppGpp synthetase/guanosine-3',5'-bis(diphosphate) 3'-pyrophosphohydrolase [Myxococcaceae bacterium]|nr:bifunctional (p)ppGpp synthetase/guanosine-3',5'-bis(diphosphate) 3'-pyrophosphohydrolase [Myxococcaceae bacterium]